MNQATMWRALFVLLMLCGTAVAAPSGDDRALSTKEWNEIRGVVDRQLKALRAGDGKQAFSYATDGIREQFGTPENFLRMVRSSYRALLDASHTQFLQGAIIGGTPFQAVRLVLPDNTVLVALYQMEKHKDGTWRIAGCTIAPSTVVAV